MHADSAAVAGQPAVPQPGADSVDAYLAAALAVITPLPPRDVPLADADGAVLAADVTAQWPLPSFDNSAMDGYAVRAAEVAAATGAAPVLLPVDGEVAAGDTRRRELAARSCIKIMTGALLPGGADAVIPVEQTDGGWRQVAIRRAAAAGDAVRHVGDDAKPGDLLLTAGTRVGAVQLGLLAASGHASVLARPRPRVTVISTGNELAEPGQPLVPGQIWESNSWMLAAAARQAGCDARRHPVLADDAGSVLAALSQAAAGADLLITSGGVSMGGEHDVVKAALSQGGAVTFRKVAMQPGAPQGFGLIGGSTPIFTLPGNPVSAFVSFWILVAPALRLLQNMDAKRAVPRRAVLTAALRSPPDKRSFARGVLDAAAGTVTPVSGQASHQLASLARSNALIEVPEQVTALAAGSTVSVLELP